MNTQIAGLLLMVAGAVLLILGRRRPTKGSSATAIGGSVAVGGSSSGPITNINVRANEPEKNGGHGITMVGIIVELIGIAVVIWHAFHLGRG